MCTLHIIGYVTIPQMQHLETTQGTGSHSVCYPKKSPIATVRAHSIRGFGPAVPHKTI